MSFISPVRPKDGEAVWVELSDTKDGKKRMLWLQFTRQET